MNGASKKIDGYYFSLIGRSHKESGTVCQDYSFVSHGTNFSFAAVADGVGSAKHSEIGSKTAIETVYNHCKNALDLDDKALLLDLLLESFPLALGKIEMIAKESNNKINDYDTTLTVAIFDGESIIYGHIGDGGIVAIDNDGLFHLLTTATKGDSWNEVIPLRADSRYYHFEIVDGSFSGLALFTDGIFDTIAPPLLKNNISPIYHNFMKNFLSAMDISHKRSACEIQDSATTLLQSDSLSILHDDLSAAVLFSTDATINIPPDDYYKEPDWEKLKNDIYYKLYPHLLPKEEVEDETN